MDKKTMEKSAQKHTPLLITVAICIILIVLGSVVGYNLGQTNPYEPEPEGNTITLEASDVAKELTLDQARVETLVNLANGYVRVKIFPEDDFTMPKGASIEAFLVDAGTIGEFGTSSEVAADEFYGVSLSDEEVDRALDQAPYALSLGRVKKIDDTEDMIIEFNTQHTLTPYDYIVLTLESDPERADYDPRPGTILYKGKLGDNLKSKKALEEAQENSEGTGEEE